MTKARSISLVCACFVSASCAASSAREVQAPTPRATYRLVEWHSNGALGHGVLLDEFDDCAMASTLALVTPEAHRIVLSQCIIARQGLLRTRLADNETAWWIELNETTGWSAASLQQFFIRSAQEAGKGLAARIVTSDGAEVAFEVRTRRDGDDHLSEAIAETAAERDQARQLLRGLPVAIYKSLRFVDEATRTSALSPTSAGGAFRSIVDVVLHLAGMVPDKGNSTKETTTRQGPHFTDKEVLQFLREFQSIQPGSPMGSFSLKSGRCGAVAQEH